MPCFKREGCLAKKEIIPYLLLIIITDFIYKMYQKEILLANKYRSILITFNHLPTYVKFNTEIQIMGRPHNWPPACIYIHSSVGKAAAESDPQAIPSRTAVPSRLRRHILSAADGEGGFSPPPVRGFLDASTFPLAARNNFFTIRP